MIEGQGFRFESDALYAYADAANGLAASVARARGELSGAGELPAGVFGEVGQGFVGAYGERARALDAAIGGIGRGAQGLADAVRGYADAKMRAEDDTAAQIRRAGEPV